MSLQNITSVPLKSTHAHSIETDTPSRNASTAATVDKFAKLCEMQLREEDSAVIHIEQQSSKPNDAVTPTVIKSSADQPTG